jgi:iron complex transport system ATP-binding protein
MLIDIANLNFAYGSNPILSDISFRVEEGQRWAIIGRNGSGKSTLIKCIAGLEKTVAGAVKINGKNINAYTAKARARSIAYVPQVSGRNLPFTVYDYVMMGRFPYQGFMAVPCANDRAVVDNALKLTETFEMCERPVFTLSGGEQQRVFLAGAVAQQSKIVLLDEPTTFLDPYHQQRIIEVLDRICRELGTTILSVTHEITTFNALYNNVLALKNGKVLYCGSIENLTTNGCSILNNLFDLPFEQVTLASGRTAVIPVQDRQSI